MRAHMCVNESLCVSVCVCVRTCVCMCQCSVRVCVMCMHEREGARLRERDSQRDSQTEREIQMVYYFQALSPLSLGRGKGIITNTKRSTHVHILNIMDTAMLF